MANSGLEKLNRVTPEKPFSFAIYPTLPAAVLSSVPPTIRTVLTAPALAKAAFGIVTLLPSFPVKSASLTHWSSSVEKTGSESTSFILSAFTNTAQ